MQANFPGLNGDGAWIKGFAFRFKTLWPDGTDSIENPHKTCQFINFVTFKAMQNLWSIVKHIFVGIGKNGQLLAGFTEEPLQIFALHLQMSWQLWNVVFRLKSVRFE